MIAPTGHADQIASEMGRRVLDLRDKGWTDARIAKHIGCDRSQVYRLVADPNLAPRHPTGMLLVSLHANVMTGVSQWARILNRLRILGFSYQQIALRCSTTEVHLHELRRDPSIVPSYEIGEKITRMLHQYEGVNPPIEKKPSRTTVKTKQRSKSTT